VAGPVLLLACGLATAGMQPAPPAATPPAAASEAAPAGGPSPIGAGIVDIETRLSRPTARGAGPGQAPDLRGSMFRVEEWNAQYPNSSQLRVQLQQASASEALPADVRQLSQALALNLPEATRGLEAMSALLAPGTGGMSVLLGATTSWAMEQGRSQAKVWLLRSQAARVCLDDRPVMREFCGLSARLDESPRTVDEDVSGAIRADLMHLPTMAMWKYGIGNSWHWAAISEQLAESAAAGQNPALLLAQLPGVEVVRDGCQKPRDTMCSLYWAGLMIRSHIATFGAAGADAVTASQADVFVAQALATLLRDGKAELAAALGRALQAPDDAKVQAVVARGVGFRDLGRQVQGASRRAAARAKRPPTPREAEAVGWAELRAMQDLQATANGLLGLGGVMVGDDQVVAWDQRFSVTTGLVGGLQSGSFKDVQPHLYGLLRGHGGLSALWEPLLPARGTSSQELTAIMYSLEMLVLLGSAQSSGEFVDVLNTYATPDAARNLKFERGLWSGGALLGVQGGVEQLAGDGEEPFWAPQLSIGLDYSRPTFGGAANTGILLAVADLGAIASRRQDDGRSERSKASWRQALSPALYLHQSLGRSSYCFGVGVGFTSDLRRVGGTERDSLRYSAFVAYDFPFFPTDW
jgi:hypothetical protein